LRGLIAFAFLLPLLGIGCQSHGAKSKELVSVDLTRLKLHQSGTSLPAQISLVPIKSVRLLPESVRSRIPKMSSREDRLTPGMYRSFSTLPDADSYSEVSRIGIVWRITSTAVSSMASRQPCSRYQAINRYLCGLMQAPGTPAWTNLPKKLTGASSRMR
jgi:hypothetical protein